MKASNLSFTLIAATILPGASAFAPSRNPYLIPTAAIRGVPVFTTTSPGFDVPDQPGLKDDGPSPGKVAKNKLDELNAGSEDDSITSRDIDLLVDILEKIHGKDTQLTTEIAEQVLSKSDAEVEHVGTQRIVTEVESPNMVAAPKAVARVVPTNQVMKKKQPANAVAGLLLKVLKVVQESGLADLTEELTYDTYKPHPEVSRRIERIVIQ